LKPLLTQVVTDVTQNQKVAVTVATGTTGSGIFTTYLEMIPSDIGKIATLIGAALSLVIIVTSIIKHNKVMKIMDLDEKIKLKELMSKGLK